MSEPVSVTVRLVEGRVLSVLVVDKAGVSAWLPRSGIDIEGIERPGQTLRVTLTEALAVEKGLRPGLAEGQGEFLL